MQPAIQNGTLKLITFVGIGRRNETVYRLPGYPDVSTAHFATALAEWFQPAQILVLLTEQAQTHENWKWMQDWASRHHYSLQPLPIPMGANEAEQWQIFEAMTQALAPQDRLIFDITHGYRSLPLLALLATLYLRLVKAVKVEHILYGAFDASQHVQPQIAPVVDMTEFLGLVDWFAGDEELIASGLSHRLAQLLEDRHIQLYREQTGRPQFLRRVGTQLHAISLALQLAQPFQLATRTAQLQERLAGAEQESHWVRPLKSIAAKIAEYYHGFEQVDLHTQHQLIQWYVEKEHWVQAVMLAREWIISVLCQYILGKPFPERTQREQIEKAWNGYLNKELTYRQRYQEKHGNSEALNALENLRAEQDFIHTLTEEERLILAKIPELFTLKSIWEKLRDMRNHIAHCGMGRDESQNPERMVRSIQALLQPLQNVPIE